MEDRINDNNLINNEEEITLNTKKEKYDENFILLCPECNKVPNIYITDPSNIILNCKKCKFNKDFSIAEILNSTSTLFNSIPFCQFERHKGIPKRSKQLCLFCKKWLCVDCINQHNRRYKRTINEHKLIDYTIYLNTQCDIHNYYYTRYCEECEEEICFECSFTNKHKSHNDKVISLESLMERQIYYKIIEKFSQAYNKIENINKKIKNHFINLAREEINKLTNQEKDKKDKKYKKISYKEKQEKIKELSSQIEQISNLYIRNTNENLNILHFIGLLIDNYNKTNGKYIFNSINNILINTKFNLITLIIEEESDMTFEKIQDYFNNDKIIKFYQPFSAENLKFKNKVLFETLRESIHSAIILNDNRRLAVVTKSFKVYIYDLIERTTDMVIKTNHLCRVEDTPRYIKESYYVNLCQLHTGELVTGSADGTIQIWKIGEIDYRLIKKMNSHKDTISNIINIDYNRFASSSFDGTINIYNSTSPYEIIYQIKQTEKLFRTIYKLMDKDFLVCFMNQAKMIFYDSNNYSIGETYDMIDISNPRALCEIRNQKLIVGGFAKFIIFNLRTFQKDKVVSLNNLFTNFPYLEEECKKLEWDKYVSTFIVINNETIIFGGGDDLIYRNQKFKPKPNEPEVKVRYVYVDNKTNTETETKNDKANNNASKNNNPKSNTTNNASNNTANNNNSNISNNNSNIANNNSNITNNNNKINKAIKVNNTTSKPSNIANKTNKTSNKTENETKEKVVYCRRVGITKTPKIMSYNIKTALLSNISENFGYTEPEKNWPNLCSLFMIENNITVSVSALGNINIYYE